MATVIKNFGQLSKALEAKIITILDLVAEDVKKEIDETLDKYCEEYSPVYYHRTNQLRNCCKIEKPKISNGNISVEVYLDIDSLKYSTLGADPYKTVVAANSGLHGGWDVSHLPSGQVSWSAISGNTGESFGSGTQIWEEPISELIDNRKLVTMFKKYAKQRGLNIV